jgi:hypothetical protein
MGTPGKYEACPDQALGEHLHHLSLDGCLDGELGDVEGFGWYGLILNVPGLGRMKSYIINEDAQGFFTYTVYDTKDAAATAWDGIELDYEGYEEEMEGEDEEDPDEEPETEHEEGDNVEDNKG